MTARLVFDRMRDGGSFFRTKQGPEAAARMPTVDATDFLLRAEDGVSGTTVVARDFYVEMFVHTKDRRPNRAIGEAGVRALVEAGKRVSGEMDPMHTIEWSSFGGIVAGSKGVCVAFVRLPHDATGVWVGNVFATAFKDDIYHQALTNVMVTSVKSRGAIVRRHVEFAQAHYDGDKEKPDNACRLVWRPVIEACEADWRPACDDPDPWETPVEVRGIVEVRAVFKKKADAAAAVAAATAAAAAAAAASGKVAIVDVEKRLDAAILRLPPGAAKVVRDRRKEAEDQKGSEGAKLRTWLAAVAAIPGEGETSPPLVPDADADAEATTAAALVKATAALDGVTHGMDEAKAAVLQRVGQLLRSPKTRLRVLGLVGPPGCGKTTFATRAIPEALGRPVQVVNLGGAKDSAVLLGHNYTYEGSRIGQVVRAFSASGVCDPVLVFDELDKVSDTAQGREITHVLMSLTDPAQNAAFADTYLSGVPVDLSRALMVFTFNDASAIDPVLLDRIQVVRVPDASRAEKREIVRRFVLPKIAEACGLVVDDLAPEALDALVAPAQGASSFSSASSDMHAGGGGLRGIERVLERALLSANVRSIRAKVPATTRIRVGVEDIREAARDADGGRSAPAFPSMYS